MEDLLSAIKKLGISEEELKKLIEERSKKLGYLIDEEVALRLIARDLGILPCNTTFSTEVKIKDLLPNMRSVTLSVTLEKNFGIKEFDKKNGSRGKVGRGIIKDETGTAFLVVWNEKAEILHKLKIGAQIIIKQAYTKEGIDGSLEIHIGEKSNIEILNEGGIRGVLWKLYDPIEYTKSDGNKVKLICFIIKERERERRVFLWNPSEEFLKNLIEGMEIEIIEGRIKNEEIYVNNDSHIRILSVNTIPITTNIIKLSEIVPNMENIAIEGIVEEDPSFTITQNGNKFTKVLLREENTILPILFWNEKAELIMKLVKKGVKLFIDGCHSKIGQNGLEVIVNKWSKIRVK
ncbi:MAG: hypothetical protein QXW62_02175 [Candidatus Methanomethylicaceae archaeon]|nr:hypothetical protein [Candidatus Verstraetearchaeota archaeon]